MDLDVICVLEDSDERVAWLRRVFSGYEIDHHLSVTSFVEALKVHATTTRLRLAIFDHDLGYPRRVADGFEGDEDGTPLFNFDKDGMTGEDAAKLCPELQCATLVWSWNSDGSRRIAHAMVDKCHRVFVARFAASVEMAAAIARAMERA